LLLFCELDKQHRLIQRMSSVLSNPRKSEQIRRKLETMTRHQVFGVAAGYGDLYDHEALRNYQVVQM